ncbi:CHAP domain-containing protein [Patulibacter defluvii]|uniref:CHAP domain-containing protein n=1 Tax=Patulibacter defluvii TaxID=3095358 RepID=UPI002A7602F4|nr:CHAP domain-containing protein [Patulibacter sp. DM4]
MSLVTALARVGELHALLRPLPPTAPAASPVTAAAPTTTTTTTAGAGGPFAAALQQASAAAGGPPPIVADALTQVGVAEQPPGSNDGPQIAGYRAAVAGDPPPGPWCAYFVSWAAARAGTPLGDRGEGFGSVDQLWGWAQRSGRAIANGPGVVPRPGDVVILNQHTGIVTGVQPDGSIATVEGNSSDRVATRVHPPGAAIGYVRLG